MMPQKDPFAQLLCDIAASVEISKQLESELEQLIQTESRESEHEVIGTHYDYNLIGAHSKAPRL